MKRRHRSGLDRGETGLSEWSRADVCVCSRFSEVVRCRRDGGLAVGARSGQKRYNYKTSNFTTTEAVNLEV